MRSRRVLVVLAIAVAGAAAWWLLRAPRSTSGARVTVDASAFGEPDAPYVRPLPTVKIDPVRDDAGALSCPGGGCTIQCADDGTCTAACAGGLCRQVCREGADCAFTCEGGSCLQRCAPGARCKMVCGGGRCVQDCAGAKECTRACDGHGCQLKP